MRRDEKGREDVRRVDNKEQILLRREEKKIGGSIEDMRYKLSIINVFEITLKSAI